MARRLTPGWRCTAFMRRVSLAKGPCEFDGPNGLALSTSRHPTATWLGTFMRSSALNVRSNQRARDLRLTDAKPECDEIAALAMMLVPTSGR